MANAPLQTLLHHVRRVVSPSVADRLPDQQLLHQFVVHRDEAAFSVLVERHGGMVLSVCRAVLGDQHEADDLFQATFLVLARKAATIRKQQSVGSWLHGVAARLARKARTSAARRRKREKQVAAQPKPTPMDELTWRELRGVLHEELARLPEKYRAALLLHYWEGKTQEEVARQLGCARDTVKDRLGHARGLLRSRLTRRGLALSAAWFAALLADHELAAAPAVLVRATLQGAMPFAAGGVVSARSALLAEEAVRAMSLNRPKVALTLVLALTVLAAGMGFAAHYTLNAQPAEAEPTFANTDGPPADPPKQQRTDRFGDPLPAGGVARLGSLRFYHGDQVENVVLSPDAKRVVSVTPSGNRLWDAVTGEELSLPDALRRAPIFPAGEELVALVPRMNDLRLWNVPTGQEMWQLPLRTFGAVPVVSPDGKTLVWGSLEPRPGRVQRVLRFCKVTTGEVSDPIDLKDDEQVAAFAFSSDCKTLVMQYANHSIHVWDVPTRSERLASAPSAADFSGMMALSPDGTTLATGPLNGNRIRLWDVRTLKELPPFENQPQEAVHFLSFSPDGKTLAVTHPSPMVSLWDLPSRKLVREIQGKDFQVFRTVFSSDGKTLAGSDGELVTLWDVATGKPRHDFGHTYCVGTLAFTPDGKTLLSGAFYTDPAIRLWDPLSGRETARWNGHTAGIAALAISPDGKLVASGSQDQTLRLWDFATGKELRRLGKTEHNVNSLAFSPEGNSLASGEATVRLWDPATGREQRAFDITGKGILHLQFAPEGNMLGTVAYDEWFVRLWDAASGKPLREVRDPAGSITAFAFSPDGKFLATNGPAATVRLRDAATGRELRVFAGEVKRRNRFTTVEAGALSFSPDGRLLAAGYSDGTVGLWEVASGLERARFAGHRNAVASTAGSPDGALLASGSWDRTVMVWDVLGRHTALEPRQLDALWDDLAAGDARTVQRALQGLLAVPQKSVPFLAERLQPATGADAQRLGRLITDLDSERFAAREQAAKDLADLGELAEPALRKVLAEKSSQEVCRRAEILLEQCDPARSAVRMRALRAVEVLEHAGTPAARRVLETLAGGAAEARLTQDARASLRRLTSRPAVP
jgi:RNA polymerase sigma factor (sigma-70 family)